MEDVSLRENITNKDSKIIKKLEKNINFVYDSTHKPVAENFKEYILSLNVNETDETENNIKVKG